MNFNLKKEILSCNSDIFSELFYTNTLVNVTRNCCQEREFKGEYYGIPQHFTEKISDERNEYISLLTLIADRLKLLHDLNMTIEKNLSYLHEDANYRS